MVCSSLGTEQKSRQYFSMDRRHICQIRICYLSNRSLRSTTVL